MDHQKVRTRRTIVLLIMSYIYYLLFVMSKYNVEAKSGLSYDFYEKSCPQVENIVRVGLQPIFSTDFTSPAAFLRLMFHDCQVQGCDASILVDPSEGSALSEMSSSRNFGVRKREAIGLLKSMVEEACPEAQVSCADILILAAREAVAVAGGPRIKVPLGRRDSWGASRLGVADSLLPSSTIGVDGMLQVFAEKGMSLEESVAIMGAHTLGITHCVNILQRLYNEPEDGEAKGVEAAGFEALLRLKCPQVSLTSNSSFVFNDPTTLAFDNLYYHNAVRGRGVLRVDAEMVTDSRTTLVVRRFVADQEAFFRAFSSAFVKLSSYGVLVGNKGVVRKTCNNAVL